MAVKNYYVILGVARDESEAGIRRAYRRAAKQSHPDVAGASGASRHRDVTTAYEVLADPAARADHDRELASAEAQREHVAVGVSRDAAVDQVARARRRLVEPYYRSPPGEPEPEPLIPGQAGPSAAPRRPWRRGASPLPDRAGALFGALDEFMDGWVPGFFTRGRTASRRKDLFVEIILEPDEAARGGLFPLQVPLLESCSACSGTGFQGLFTCPACAGHGRVRGVRAVEISMPARVSDGTRARLSLEDVGLRGVDLHVLVSVGPTGGVRKKMSGAR